MFPMRGFSFPRILTTRNNTFVILWLSLDFSWSILNASEYSNYDTALQRCEEIAREEYKKHFGELPPDDFKIDIKFFDMK